MLILSWRPKPGAGLVFACVVSLAVVIAAPPVVAGPQSPASTPTSEAVYVVRRGDYLAGIAARLSVTMPALLATNGLTVDSVIFPGDQLKVPSNGKLPSIVSLVPADAATATLKYTVKAGDYLIAIAIRNGVSFKELLAANNLIASSTILPGTQLALPPASQPIPALPPSLAAAAAAPSPTTTSAPGASTLAPGVAPASALPSTDTASSSIATLLTFLDAQVGKPYAFNTAGPDTYDCSGLVTAAYAQVGFTLPHQSLLQSQLGSAVDWRTDDIQAGDLVFSFSTGKTYISHVGIAISSTQWIQASGSTVPVRLGRLPNDDKIQTVRRILTP